MRAIIVGAGEVGFDIALTLTQEKHDVIILDTDAARLDDIKGKLDVLAVQGTGTSANALEQAGARRADLLVAVTAVDEVNIIACMMADRLGVPTTVARIRSPEYSGGASVLRAQDLGIDYVIHPEETTAEEVVRLIRRAGATDVIEFAGGALQLLGLRVDEDSPVRDMKIHDISERLPDVTFRIMAIGRGIRSIIPTGTDVLKRGDQIFVLAFAVDIPRLTKSFGKGDVPLQDLMILGGNPVGAHVARVLSRESSKRIKLIEADRERARLLAEMLPDVLVIHGDPTDVDLLALEGIGEMHAFVAVTDDEESNLVTCLLAKHLGVRKTVALLSKAAYIPIGERIGLDAAVSKKQAVSREVLRFLRGKHVLSVATVHGIDAEILELRAGQDSAITRSPVRKLRIPRGVLLGFLISEASTMIVTGDTQVSPGDRVIAFVLPSVIREIKRLFD